MAFFCHFLKLGQMFVLKYDFLLDFSLMRILVLKWLCVQMGGTLGSEKIKAKKSFTNQFLGSFQYTGSVSIFNFKHIIVPESEIRNNSWMKIVTWQKVNCAKKIRSRSTWNRVLGFPRISSEDPVTAYLQARISSSVDKSQKDDTIVSRHATFYSSLFQHATLWLVDIFVLMLFCAPLKTQIIVSVQ